VPTGAAPLTGVDNITGAGSGDLYVAEDGGNMEINVITPAGVVAPFLRILNQSSSEITGPAFSPDGRRLYFSSQRGTTGRSSGGITYEVTGPFRC
jgi:secreted PhoX family phosphatase